MGALRQQRLTRRPSGQWPSGSTDRVEPQANDAATEALPPMRFRAFLSYSHADAAWARWLLRRLETYQVPSRLVGTHGVHGEIGRRLGTFFRDRDELPSAGDLGTTIREALADSTNLIVICSPAAAASRWVNAEVEAFQASGRGDRVLCFVVAGVPGSTDPAGQCFPPALLQPDADGAVRESLAADARPPDRRRP